MNRTLRTVLPLIILVGGLGSAVGLIATKKKPERSKPATLPPKVEVVRVTRESAPAEVEALGTVTPAKTLVVQPELSGRVVYVHPELVPGGTIRAGEVLVRLDSREFRLALEERKAALEKAQFELALEEGRGRVAEREWKLVGAESKTAGIQGKALALREPHLANAQAALQGAQAGVERAELNVARTVIRAPFDVLVRSENVEVGQIVSPQSQLATVVGTEAFWIQTAVPLSSLRWIHGAEHASPSAATVRLMLGEDGVAEREGSVLRVTGELDPKGQMARVIVRVPDPLGLDAPGTPRLLLGAYVRVGIAGRALDDVFVVPRIALRQGGLLWVADGEDKLRIRETRAVWSNEREVYVRDGVKDGERVVTSRIAAPVEGMALRVDGDPAGVTAQKPAAATEEATP